MNYQVTVKIGNTEKTKNLIHFIMKMENNEIFSRSILNIHLLFFSRHSMHNRHSMTETNAFAQWEIQRRESDSEKYLRSLCKTEDIK